MSLINDALKRAKETHQQRPATPPPGPPLRPAERPRGRGGSLWLVVAFVVVLAAAGVLLWQWAMQNRKPAREIATSSPTQALTPEAPKPSPPAPIQTPPVATAPPSKPAENKPATAQPMPTPVTPLPEAKPGTQVLAASPAPAPATAAVSNAVVAAAPLSPPVATAAPPVAAEAPPKPSLKLQGIVYIPARPSAIINGKTLFVGDRIAEFRVMAIETERVMLVGGGTTNILSLQ